MAKNNNYKDLDLNFTPHPVTGDINILKDIEAVKRSVRNLILHNFYERPFRSNIGSGVKQSLFENMGPVQVYQLKANIESAIAIHEKRAKLLSVNLIDKSDENGLELEVVFSVNNAFEPVTVNVFLKRVR